MSSHESSHASLDSCIEELKSIDFSLKNLKNTYKNTWEFAFQPSLLNQALAAYFGISLTIPIYSTPLSFISENNYFYMFHGYSNNRSQFNNGENHQTILNLAEQLLFNSLSNDVVEKISKASFNLTLKTESATAAKAFLQKVRENKLHLANENYAQLHSLESVLGITEPLTRNNLRKQYLLLALAFHSDKVVGNLQSECTEMFKFLGNVKDLLEVKLNKSNK